MVRSPKQPNTKINKKQSRLLMLTLPFCSHFESDLHEGLQGAWVGGVSTVSLSPQSVRSINVAGCCLRRNSIQPFPYTHTQINTELIMTVKEMLSKNSYRPQRSFLLGRGSWSGSRSEFQPPILLSLPTAW